MDDESRLEFSAIPKLSVLRLDDTQIGNQTLKSLVKCRWLSGLDLSHTNVDDSGLRCLRSFSRLENLILNGTSISENSLEQLSACKSLKVVHCANTGFAVERIEAR